MAATRSEDWTAALGELAMTLKAMVRGISRRRGRETHLGGSQVSHAQFEMLVELHDRGELSAGELASAADLTPATVTQMLDHLAEGGFVERARSRDDRRVVVSRLTEEGARLTRARREEWRRRWVAALGDFSAAEMRIAARILRQLCAVFDEAPALTSEDGARRRASEGDGVQRPAPSANDMHRPVPDERGARARERRDGAR